jgi:hypothetical protein
MKKRYKEPIDYDQKRQRRVLFFSLFMIAIMLFSTVAYYVIDGAQGTSSQQTKYGEYEFSLKDLGQGNQVLVTNMNGQEVEFQNLPVQVQFLELDPAIMSLLKNATQIIWSIDPNMTPENLQAVDYARLELNLAIPKSYNAVAAEGSAYTSPVVNCSQALQEQPVVLFTQSNVTSVMLQDSCVVISAEYIDVLRYKDRIIFEYYDILRNGEVVDE